MNKSIIGSKIGVDVLNFTRAGPISAYIVLDTHVTSGDGLESNRVN